MMHTAACWPAGKGGRKGGWASRNKPGTPFKQCKECVPEYGAHVMRADMTTVQHLLPAACMHALFPCVPLPSMPALPHASSPPSSPLSPALRQV